MRRHETTSRFRPFTRRLAVLLITIAAGLGLGPVAAHADTWRTATGSGWGSTPDTASAAAQSSARAELTRQAAALGEVCTGVTSSATLSYTVPSGGGYVYSGTATGSCAPAPPSPYTVPRGATARGEGRTYSLARDNGAARARADILVAGGDCTGYQVTNMAQVYTAPDGSWYIYDVTVSATCVR
ncbi:hypothetical protein Sru01_06970 [Sphaerisporangium rufum]|uniref:Secreted protein n=1 Tax=Sphaerisporangium rufum TaxID=1381558 RepID=A0A919QZK7_9ACTN|nr:hypothetical protein [Sphaerisporangium rufum]GII75715.1 hypothetical protein Sru01_06970 [Sphaerisporangium rufum]